MSANIKPVTIENVRELLELSFTQPVLFYFYSERSPACLNLGPVLQRIAQTYPDALTLAVVDCDQEQQLAAHFGVRSLPTVLFIKEGQPVDGFAGEEPEQAILQRLSAFLPKPEDQLLQQALPLLEQQNWTEAYPLLKEANELVPERVDIRLQLALVQVELGQLDAAEKALATVLMADQDALYQSVKARLELAQQASDSPEVKALEQALVTDPDNKELQQQLAVQYHQVQRSAEALALLYEILKQDLNFGEAKKLYLDILATLPKGEPLASSYRRKLYSLLY
ncbi:MAG: tetratricopeptide repeat protein [Gammaproteobacteria bacterium]|nr:tetratricopeptide repeat protein [Gammaproteobacteria bacterium]MBU2059298.1 tetratricopeptide repeat protein [Gammaproteobacteria bacterium]MBU2175322.1 tetratricopeptide repeat protein [Gammaproteobacteria bacterium]MBU2247530.1 tetratricopeptide repeat protein [Gammaproteobacteria bacterium]MBU2342710.1 tetratricopeptide repeat protein [Gammaproteobacteria bacterium]